MGLTEVAESVADHRARLTTAVAVPPLLVTEQRWWLTQAGELAVSPVDARLPVQTDHRYSFTSQISTPSSKGRMK